MRLLIYLRVSTSQQFKNENPISSQRAACLSYIERMKHSVNEEEDIYIDGGISGRTDDRAAFKKMLERLKDDKAIGGVVAYDVSRIFRNVGEYLKFRESINKWGKSFFSVSENFTQDDSSGSWFSETMSAVFAEFRSRQDGEKISLGMRNKGISGIYPGRAPFGYRNLREVVYGGKDRRWMETDPITSVWVKEIFQKYATGRYSLYKLAEEMTARGCPAPNKKPWATSSLEKILKKKTYIGFIDWGGLDNPNGKHEKLIDDETFFKVQALMKARNYGSNKERKYTFIFRGLAWCGECGSRITGIHRRKRLKTYHFYCCPKVQHSKLVKCSQSAFNVDDGEKQLQKIVKSIQIPESASVKLTQKIKAIMANDKKGHEDFRKSLLIKQENIETKKKSLLEKFVDESIDDDSYRKYKLDLETQEVQIKSELSKIEGNLAKMVEDIETAISLARNCYKTYKEAGYDQKILLAQTIFEKFIVKDKKIVSAFLNHPFAYICKDKANKLEVFQYQYDCGDGEN